MCKANSKTEKLPALAFPSQVMRIGDATATDYWVVLRPIDKGSNPSCANAFSCFLGCQPCGPR